VSGGLGVAALGLILCLLAAAFGAPSLYLPGVALILLAAAAELSVRISARRCGVARDPLLASVEEGAPLQLAVHVQGGRLPIAAGELCPLPGIEPMPLRRLSRGVMQFTATLHRRGAHVVGPSVVRFRDPLGISVRRVRSGETEVLVLPRVERIPHEQLARITGHGREAQTRSRGATVARTGVLVERSLSSESDRLPLVVLDLRRAAGADAMDMGVRATASLCFGLASVGGCSLLLPGEHRAHRLDRELGAWPAMHARLALVQPGGPPASAPLERAAVVIWVTVSRRPHPDAARVAGGIRYCVSPFPRTGGAVLFEIAGCAVQVDGRAASTRAA
jgi:uncharacterized protein (DUF58 family)